MTATIATAPGLYFADPLPIHWIWISRSGERWLVPAIRNGWDKKVPYNGNYMLHRAEPFMLRLACINVPDEEAEACHHV